MCPGLPLHPILLTLLPTKPPTHVTTLVITSTKPLTIPFCPTWAGASHNHYPLDSPVQSCRMTKIMTSISQLLPQKASLTLFAVQCEVILSMRGYSASAIWLRKRTFLFWMPTPAGSPYPSWSGITTHKHLFYKITDHQYFLFRLNYEPSCQKLQIPCCTKGRQGPPNMNCAVRVWYNLPPSHYCKL